MRRAIRGTWLGDSATLPPGAIAEGMAMRAWAAACLFLVASCAGGAAFGDNPESFVRNLYARFAADPNFFIGPGRGGVAEEMVYSPSLIRLLEAERARYPAELRSSSMNICDCQEHDRVSPPDIVVRWTGPASAEASVQLLIEDFYVRSMRLMLVRTPAGWRVDDIAAVAVGTVASPDRTRVNYDHEIEVASWRKMLIDDLK